MYMEVLSIIDVSDTLDARTLMSFRVANEVTVDVMCKHELGSNKKNVLWYVMDPVLEEVNQTEVLQYAKSLT